MAGTEVAGSVDLIFNVSGLLKEHIGITRKYEVADSEIQLDDGTMATDLHGRLVFMRSGRGIMVNGEMNCEVDLTCSRCLTWYKQRLDFALEDEFVSTVDVSTGLPVELPDDAEDFYLLDHKHTLDVNEPVRQSVLVAIPMRPLCDDRCAGLCMQCGKNLNEGSCRCKSVPQANPFAELSRLVVDDLQKL
jgi:uncharacterized protein